jgi:thiol-disulfide isomerase/thioredoxin
MKAVRLQFLQKNIFDWRHFLALSLLVISFLIASVQPATAGIKDDKYDGNIFVVYAGNGSLVPAKVTLKQSLEENKPAILVYYVDDSRDCKQYALIVSRIQEFYGRAAEIIPVDVDAIPVKSAYSPQEIGYYYSGEVPQVLVFNKSGDVVLNKKGQVPYEEIDDRLREVFDLLPRAESVELKRRSFNEFNSELTK